MVDCGQHFRYVSKFLITQKVLTVINIVYDITCVKIEGKCAFTHLCGGTSRENIAREHYMIK